jgi:hypothetical protein
MQISIDQTRADKVILLDESNEQQLQQLAQRVNGIVCHSVWRAYVRARERVAVSISMW